MNDKTLDTGELRRVVSEEVRKALHGMATLEDVDNHIVTKLAPYARRDEVKIIVDERTKTMWDEIKQGIADLKTMVAVLVEQNKNNNQLIQDLKTTQQRIDAEQDVLKQMNAKRGERLTALESRVSEHIIDVFGSPDRIGQSSLLDHLNTGIKSLAEMMGNQHQETMSHIQVSNNGIAMLKADVVSIQQKQNEHSAFIDARKKFEAMVVQSIPKAGRVVMDNITDRVKWSAAAGLISIAVAVLVKLSGG